MPSIPQLTPQQQQIVDHWGSGLAVLAGAGTGKTTTLVLKCQELIRLHPEARFAAVSFTERSAADLESKLSRQIPLRSHCVATIHGLCGRIIREFPEAAGIDGDESILAEAESQKFWQQSMDSLWQESRNSDQALRSALEKILRNESRRSLQKLMTTLKNWETFGVLEKLTASALRDEGEGPLSGDLALLTREALLRYQRSKQRLAMLDFSDLEKCADRALQDPWVRKTLQSRFDLIMIDEFQDTNPVQARIVWSLVRADLSNLVVVGDPKQSIYRFRDADVSLFEELVKQLPHQLELSWNFRSRPPIIQFVNETCDELFAASDLSFQRLEARRPEAEEAGSQVIQLQLQKPEDLATWIRQEVDRGMDLSSMVLLLRKIRGANEKWLAALSRSGIPLAVGSGGRFWQDPRVRELASLLLAWRQPENSLAAMVFLRAPWVGLKDHQLDVWAREAVADATQAEGKSDLLQKFFDSPNGKEHYLATVLRESYDKALRPAEVLMKILDSPGMEEYLGNSLLGLWHRCEEWSQLGWNFYEIARHLSKILAGEIDTREGDLPPPRNQGQLRVMSVHASKGLEFDQVLMVDFAGRSRADASPSLYWHRERGVHWMGRLSDGQRDDKDPLTQEWKDWEKRQVLAESKRVFYVALTRAKERLILVTLPQSSKEQERSTKEDLKQDNWRAWVEYAVQSSGLKVENFSTAPQSPLLSSASATMVPLWSSSEIQSKKQKSNSTHRTQWQRPRHSVTEWMKLDSCPRSYEWKFLRPRLPSLSNAPLPSSEASEVNVLSKDGALDLGSQVHQLLELGDNQGLVELEKKLGSDIFRAQPLLDWLERSPLGQTNQVNPELQVSHELSFEVPLPSIEERQHLEVLVGTLDKWILTADEGWIIDYKVGQKSRTPEDLLRTYQLQVELYAWAMGKMMFHSHPHLPLRAWIVQISPTAVQEVSVPLGKNLEEKVISLLRKSQQIIRSGEDSTGAIPRSGPGCRYCEFRSICPESV